MRSLLPEAWSYSALNQFLRICGAQYLFERVEGIEPEVESPNVVLGSALHHAASFMRVRQAKGESVLLTDASEVFAESFSVLGANPIVGFGEGEAESLREEGLKYVALLHANVISEKVEVVAVEQDFLVPLINPVTGEEHARSLKGVMDVVLRTAEGEIVVVDVKTAATRYSSARITNDLQATAYSYAASRLWNGGARFRWDVVLKHRTPSFERVYANRDDRDFARLIALVKTAERAIEAGVFIPNDGSFYCSGCAFKSACAEWTERQLLPLASGRAVA